MTLSLRGKDDCSQERRGRSKHSPARKDTSRKIRSRTPRRRSKEKKDKKEKERKKRDKQRDKDKDTPHFSWRPGMSLGPTQRYVVDRLLGDGTFGRVLSCVDTKTNQIVAVKVVKGVKRYCEHAEAEAEVLSEIHQQDVYGESLCVKLLNTFHHTKRHFCLVFEPLGCSIRDFLKNQTDSLGMYLEDAAEISRQLLESLAFLHSIGLVHTDLKCRNIMLRSGEVFEAPHPRVQGAKTSRPRDCRIAVIDFGGAVFEDDWHGSRIGTRQFRGPEVVLGLPWDETSDLWSAACIIVMLYLGQRLFSVHEDMEHLAMMEKILGEQLPSFMAKEAKLSGGCPEGIKFTSDWRINWPQEAPDSEAVERVEDLEPLKDLVLPRHSSFLQLLEGLYRLEPSRRSSAVSSLQLPFFKEGIIE